MQIVDEINDFNPDEESALRARMAKTQSDLAKLLRRGYTPQSEPESAYNRREEIAAERWEKRKARKKASDKRRKARQAAKAR